MERRIVDEMNLNPVDAVYILQLRNCPLAALQLGVFDFLKSAGKKEVILG